MLCRNLLCMAWLLSIVQPLLSQEVHSEEHSMKGAHRITFGLGHTHLARGKNADGNITWLPAPSWSLNYDYWIGNKWAIGLQTELVMEKFIVEDDDGQELERAHPIALIPVGVYRPFKHLSFIAGAGVEFEEEKNLGLSRLGAEFGVELPKGWEVGMALAWDAKWGYYDSWVFDFSFSKIFKGKKKH